MKKIPKFVWILIALVGIYAGARMAWDAVYPFGSWRYKMTVVVDTPEGEKIGSAVREVDAYSYPQLISATNAVAYVKGEAVVVDLGKRGVLFALMHQDTDADYPYNIVFKAFPFPGELTAEGIKHYRSLKTGKAVLESKEYPEFVKFDDLKDPNTIHPTYYLPSAFGEGVNLKEITIEMTDEPVTHEIKKWLPWLTSFKVNFGPDSVPGKPNYYKNLLLDTNNFYIGE